MLTDRHAFILRHTRRRHPPHTPELCLHLADEVLPLWRTIEQDTGARGVAPPFWAFAWAGGQAVARYLLDHPEMVAGKRVLDFAAGSGLCAIAAMTAGACYALAADVDPYGEAAVAINARANGVRVAFTGCDLLDAVPPDADLIVAGDVCYEQPLATRVLAWLQTAHARGIGVLIGDPGRAYFPHRDLVRLADYVVPTSRDLEGVEVKRAGVFTFPPLPIGTQGATLFRQPRMRGSP
jgi:predicted nicotinamide N-methyase